MTRTGIADPSEYLGIYKSIDDVPDMYSLSRLSVGYSDQDLWAEFIESRSHLSEATIKYTYGRLERLWKPFCEKRGINPAFPDPDDVEDFFAQQLAERSIQTVYDSRFVPLFKFFEWLLHHTEYPHRYNPVVMAAVSGEAGFRLWEKRLEECGVEK
ncbi:hypothetical protein [Halobellus rubicundus]|uniref:Core-binding (CB) domain-containing protein n=1 Tax=Halobellus rubicundus TaxID=2996466 RepID=A0ABD5MEW7_9EURY